MKSRRFENVCANYALSAADGGIDTSDLQKLAKSKGIDYKTLSRHQLLHVLCGHKSENDNITVADVYKPLLKTPIIDMLIRNNRVAGGVPGLTAVVHNILKQYYSATVHLPKRLWTVDALAIVDYWLLSVDKYIVEYMVYGNSKYGAMLGAYGRLPSITLFDKSPEVQRRMIDDLPAYTDLLNRAFNNKYAYRHFTDAKTLRYFYRDIWNCFRIIGLKNMFDNYRIMHLEGYSNMEFGDTDEGRWVAQLTHEAKIIVDMKNNMFHGDFMLLDQDDNEIVIGMFVDNYMTGTWTHYYEPNAKDVFTLDNDGVIVAKQRFFANGDFVDLKYTGTKLTDVYVRKDGTMGHEWFYTVDTQNYITGTHRIFFSKELYNEGFFDEITVDEKTLEIVAKYHHMEEGPVHIYKYKDGKFISAKIDDSTATQIIKLSAHITLLAFLPGSALKLMCRKYFTQLETATLLVAHSILVNSLAYDTNDDAAGDDTSDDDTSDEIDYDTIIPGYYTL